MDILLFYFFKGFFEKISIFIWIKSWVYWSWNSKIIEYEGVSRLSQQSLNETVDIKAGDVWQKKLNIALKNFFLTILMIFI